MIEQQARVTRTVGGTAWVSLGGQSGCTACNAGQGCGAGLFGRLLRRRAVELTLANGIEARAGQAVMLGMPESLFLRLVFRLYGWPLVAGLAGALTGHQVAKGFMAGQGAADLLTLAGMIAGAALTLAALRSRGLALPGGGIRLLPGAPGAHCEKSGTPRPE
jgi:sigma-E factor negative regulatory protein RseC